MVWTMASRGQRGLSVSCYSHCTLSGCRCEKEPELSLLLCWSLWSKHQNPFGDKSLVQTLQVAQTADHSSGCLQSWRVQGLSGYGTRKRCPWKDRCVRVTSSADSSCDRRELDQPAEVKVKRRSMGPCYCKHYAGGRLAALSYEQRIFSLPWRSR